MADTTKYAPINGGTLISDLKSHFSIHTTKKRTITIAYGFIFIFIAITTFLAFSPSSNSSSPWFTNIFTANNTTILSDESYRSHFSSIFYYFFPNSSQSHYDASQNTHFSPPILQNKTKNEEITHKVEVLNPINATISTKTPVLNQTVNNSTTPQKPSSNLSKGSLNFKNQTQNQHLNDKVEVLNLNNATVSPEKPFSNRTANNSSIPPKPSSTLSKGSSEIKNQTQNNQFSDKDEVLKPNQSTSTNLTSKQSNVTTNTTKTDQGIDDMMKSLMNCDMFDGHWVRDESYPLYKPGSCSLIDEQFNCFVNGRPDNGYLKYKWKPKDCTLPRLNGSHMLEMLRGKRLVFVGDSLNRNMWESLICILRNSAKNPKKVYEASGKHHFRAEASYSFIFEDYKFTVEFFVSPFLVQEWETGDKSGSKKETLRLDLVGRSAEKYKNADIIVFNTGHWWTHDKTSKGKDYYQEGSHVYGELNVAEAFRKAITTWGRWVDANVNPMKSLVFFRGYSASHFRGGQWNSGGACDHETEPIKNETYLSHYPPKMAVLERVLRGMKTDVTYLNVTRMTDYRKDGHPSIYRKQHLSDEERRSPLRFQDCSHWCLPGVPDAWNEILYAELLVKLNRKQQSHKRP